MSRKLTELVAQNYSDSTNGIICTAYEGEMSWNIIFTFSGM
jgi:hypothetical protein